MNTRKTLPTMTKPFAHVHSTLTALGFTEAPCREGCLYEILFRDPLTQQQYPFRILTQTRDDGQTEVHLGQAGFHSKDNVPSEAEEAAKEMLGELVAYLANDPGKRRKRSLQHTMNSMASSEEDVVRLGKVMSNMPTNSQVRESGMVPDPIQ
ncbi:hypothetical protein RAC89_11275 [Paenibacillus sp. GD4]|uniref:hypothetical protein n=1 Tax=Paenibacillus sp. GD4 TaxID=3068890 RepID=UPI002796DB40|nr:hypothetical protein [Paenibacillus sp. GD4]MDQ1911032.1 hypothetical protein [Paenibacillus sp. GD4]